MSVTGHTYTKKDILANETISGNVPATGGLGNSEKILTVKQDGTGYELTEGTTINHLPSLTAVDPILSLDLSVIINSVTNRPVFYSVVSNSFQNTIDLINSLGNFKLTKNGVVTDVSSYTAKEGEFIAVWKNTNGDIVLHVDNKGVSKDFEEKLFKVATNYSNLSTFVGMHLGALAYVESSEGTKWLPGSIGGSFYAKGWYVYNGTNWVSDRVNISEEFEKLQPINDWNYLVMNWSVEPFLNSNNGTGDIYEYILEGITRYRFIPTTYDPTQDAFYSDLALTQLLTVRG